MRATHHGRENSSPLQAEYICADLPSRPQLSLAAGRRTIHFRPSDCELQFSREFRLGILLVRCTTGRLVALYAHLELADSIVNLLCVGPSVTENQAASSRWVQVACGQWRCGNAPLGSLPGKRHIINAGRQHCH